MSTKPQTLGDWLERRTGVQGADYRAVRYSYSDLMHDPHSDLCVFRAWERDDAMVMHARWYCHIETCPALNGECIVRPPEQ